MESWQLVETAKGLFDDTEKSDIVKQAFAICRSYGAGSEQYRLFLDEASASSIGEMLDLPKFVPGDIRTSIQSKKSKKRRQKMNRPPLPKTVGTKAGLPPQQGVNKPQESEWKSSSALVGRPEEQKLEVYNERPVFSKSRTLVQRKTEPSSEEAARTLRRTQSTLPNEQSAMDEQVALQLQSLLREKAELLKENSRLRNENAGLHELLEYATCEAAVDDGEASEQEETYIKESMRRSGIQAWHPMSFYAPDSASSIGVGSSSSTDEKETQVGGVTPTIPGSFHFSR